MNEQAIIENLISLLEKGPAFPTRDDSSWRDGISDAIELIRYDLGITEGPEHSTECEWCGSQQHADEQCPKSPERHPVTGE
jgi:hypothetical protein